MLSCTQKTSLKWVIVPIVWNLQRWMWTSSIHGVLQKVEEAMVRRTNSCRSHHTARRTEHTSQCYLKKKDCTDSKWGQTYQVRCACWHGLYNLVELSAQTNCHSALALFPLHGRDLEDISSEMETGNAKEQMYTIAALSAMHFSEVELISLLKCTKLFYKPDASSKTWWLTSVS